MNAPPHVFALSEKLRGEKHGPVRRLSGFKKTHRVPDAHFSAADAFVRRAGHGEVKGQAEAIHEGIRSAFGHRRKDIGYACADGKASIRTPDFDVSLAIAQDAKDPGKYLLVTEISGFRRPAVVDEDGFSRVFSPYCDTVEIEFSRSLNLEEKIDDIEALPALRKYLVYEADSSSFTLALPRPEILIRATADRIAFSLLRRGNVKTLMGHTREALAALTGSGVDMLGP
ncbi:MAG TPA: hypothetical protein VII09_03615 [Opitutaceae bacterium]